MPSAGSPRADSMDEVEDEDGRPARRPADDPARTPFLAILLYVLGFMGALALAAWILALLLRHR
jgi:hypothetical protein